VGSGQRHRPHIPTDVNGEVIQLRSKWHNTIRYLAKRELDLGKRNILEYPKSKLDLIANEVEDMFTYDTPLKEGAVRAYLLTSSRSRGTAGKRTSKPLENDIQGVRKRRFRN
jgi:hypothetical protein